MSKKQEQPVPVWHKIVGDDCEPVLVGQLTKTDDEVLVAGGWITASAGGFRQTADSLPRRRRKRRYDVQVMSGGVNYCRIKAANPGDCFMLAEDGELVPIEVER